MRTSLAGPSRRLGAVAPRVSALPHLSSSILWHPSAPEQRRVLSSSFVAPRKATLLDVKDRTRYPAALNRPGARNLAVFVDADGMTPGEVFSLEKTIASLGDRVVLRRYFSIEESGAWRAVRGMPSAGPRPAFDGQGIASAYRDESSSSFSSSSHPNADEEARYELFMVDSFMPIHIQLLADVAHVMDHRAENGATCACVVVPAVHAEPYGNAFVHCESARATWESIRRVGDEHQKRDRKVTGGGFQSPAAGGEPWAWSVVVPGKGVTASGVSPAHYHDVSDGG